MGSDHSSKWLNPIAIRMDQKDSRKAKTERGKVCHTLSLAEQKECPAPSQITPKHMHTHSDVQSLRPHIPSQTFRPHSNPQ